MVSQRKDTDLPGLAARAERAKVEGDPPGFMSGWLFYSDFAIILGGCPFVPHLSQFHTHSSIKKRKLLIPIVFLGD
jgi:hypothetical protein